MHPILTPGEIHAPTAAAVVLATAVTDAIYVRFVAAVSAKHAVHSANWSACWYLFSAFTVLSYTSNSVYVLFAALGSWIGGYISVRSSKNKEPHE